jgi:glutaminyl-peptide cyclotransferase
MGTRGIHLYFSPMLTALVLAAFAAAAPAQKPRAAAAPAAFDSTRAFRYLKEQCDLGPRNPGSEGHERAIAYFDRHFASLGLAVEKQAFVHRDMVDGHEVRLTNLLVTVKGRDAKAPGMIFCAHWDTRPRADQDPDPRAAARAIIGANDGASGVAVLMELAHSFQKRPPPRTVHLALFDGEDYGKSGSLDEYFLGARHYAERLPQPRPAYAILLDMVGDRDLSLPMERNSLAQAPDLVKKVWDRARVLGLRAFQPVAGPMVFDDHMPLLAKGLPALDIIDFEYPPWHTQGDTPDKCSAYSLGVVGRLVSSLAWQPLP